MKNSINKFRIKVCILTLMLSTSLVSIVEASCLDDYSAAIHTAIDNYESNLETCVGKPCRREARAIFNMQADAADSNLSQCQAEQ